MKVMNLGERSVNSMKGKVAKERVIYDNYDLCEQYTDEDIISHARECEWIDEDETPTDGQIWEWRYEFSQTDWEDAWYELREFFEGKTVGFFGEVGLWHGVYKAGKIGNFEQLFYRAIKDCDYMKFTDENGHLYLTCSHHDGTNHFEIREITHEGNEYLDRWEWGDDNRTEEYVHNQIYKRYSKLPRFAEKVMGCKAKEYEPITKGRLIDMVNSQASSRYSA